MNIIQLKDQYKAGERNFRGAQLSGVNLVWVELIDVNFQSADLSHSNLSGANFSGSDFSDGANLTFADLSRADLCNTNLKSARLEGANLEGIQLSGAIYDDTTKFPIGFDPQKAGAVASGSLQSLPVLSDPVQLAAEPESPAASSRPALARKSVSANDRPSQSKAEQDNPIRPALDAAKELLQIVKRGAGDVVTLQEARLKEGRPTLTKEPVSPPAFDLNTSGQGKTAVLPASIKGSWNLGAFLLPGLRFLTNRVWFCAWIWLIVLIPFIGNFLAFCFAIAFAANGNRWA